MLGFVLACVLPAPLVVDDADDDGVTVAGGDCDDADGAVFPGAEEVCNRIDDDCDGTVDAGVCGAYDPGEDDGTSFVGESGVGATIVVGRFDGDAVPDLVTAAQIGTSSAVCLVGGVRVRPIVNQPLFDVANCWISAPSRTPPVAVSAERYGLGLPSGQAVALVSSGTRVCALNPFGAAYTLDGAAYGCIDETALPVELQGNLSLLAADFDRGTVGGVNGAYLGVVDPVDYLAGATVTGPVVQFPARITVAKSGGDLDGDGVTDMIVAVQTRAYLLPGDIDLTGPVELITPYHVDTDEPVTGVAGVGDVDGDGRAEWATVSADGAQVWSVTEPFSRIAGAVDPVAAAGDFDADGRSDVWVHFAVSGDVAGEMLYLGGPWPETRYLFDDEDLAITKIDGGFAAAVAAAGDLFGDGYGDTWFTAPTLEFDGVVRGKVYLVEGWGLDPAPPDSAEDTATATPVE